MEERWTVTWWTFERTFKIQVEFSGTKLDEAGHVKWN